MAMGLISQKGNGNNGQRSRPCGLLLLLAFGAAMLAIMTLHKLRERRIFNLLLQENGRHLVSLRLLLQKQTEYTKELKKNAEETKAKMSSLRKQKMEEDHRLLEMQSTIDSLKDEQKTMESELEDKLNEIKLLRHSGNRNPQAIALIATLKQKEAEIQDLNNHLNSSVRVRSLHPPINVTLTEQNKELRTEDGGVHESSAYEGGDNSTKGQDGNDTRSDYPHEEDNSDSGNEKKGMYIKGGEQLQNQRSGEMNAKRTTRIDMGNNHARTTATMDQMDEGKNGSSFTGQPGKLKSSPQGEISGNKLETEDSSNKISSLSEAERFGNLSTTKGKTWRILARKRFLKKKVNSEIDGVESTSRRFSKEYNDVVRRMEEGEKPEKGKEMDLAKADLLKHHNSEPEDIEDRKDNRESVVEDENAMSSNQHNHEARQVSENSGFIGEASNYTHDVKQQRIEEATNNSADMKQQKKKTANRDEMEAEDKQAAANGDLSSDFSSDSEDKQKYGTETEF
ncbi:hypothetical protein HRI_002053500 [Hibiscus trionum]|uniref:Micronuclear linker histone polyprotein-like protein n=1 Tax=Hibiscus trionum TaxID=183268 RepID=A0A9W7HUS7_HIBTR|nr:hypothetical protein HRI_002053500 [Hibiscus trionum]